MKKILLTAIVSLLALHLHAQWTARLVRKFDGFQFHRIIAAANGYYAVGTRSRAVPWPGSTGNSTYDKRTAVLLHLDRNFATVWEKSFPEGEVDFWNIEVRDEVLYLGGTAFAKDDTETAIEVACDMGGNVRWQRKHALPECGGSSFFYKEPMPGGDVYAYYRTGDCHGSAQRGYLVSERLRPDGKAVWTRREIINSDNSPGPMLMLENGDQLRIGHAYAGGTSGTWTYDVVVTLHAGDTGKLKWTKRHRLPGRFDVAGILRLPGGNIGINGTYVEGSSRGTEYKGFVAIFSPEGELLEHRSWQEGHATEMAHLVQLPDGTIMATARCRTSEHATPYLMVYELDGQLHLLRKSRIEANLYSYVHLGVEGTLFVRSVDEIWVLEGGSLSGR